MSRIPTPYVPPVEWMTDAALEARMTELGLCSGVDNDDWFPEPADRRNPAEVDAERDYARSICGGCPAALECLEVALRGNRKHGVWGGTTPHEREQLRRERIQVTVGSDDTIGVAA
jgi:WhiB family redox-sensing transcriptional regulator